MPLEMVLLDRFIAVSKCLKMLGFMAKIFENIFYYIIKSIITDFFNMLTSNREGAQKVVCYL